jgi:hypothetical protein
MAMTTCTLPAARQPARSLLRRLRDGFQRHFHWPVLVSRELVDRAWLDAGLGRQDRVTLDDAGTPSWVAGRDEVRDAWEALGALDRVRRM